MKTKRLMRDVQKIGGTLVKTKGSHKIFKLPNGESICIPFSGAHTEVSPGLLSKIRKVLARQVVST